MDKKDIFILGVGHNTEVFIDLVEACGYTPAGLFHYKTGREGEKIHNIPILDCHENLFKQDLKGKLFAISVGNNLIRKELAKKIIKQGGVLPTLIHPSAIVSKYANIDQGVIIQANAVVQAGASIEKYSVISFNASVTHTSHIGQNCYLAAHSHIGAYCKVHDNVLIGQGALTISGKVQYIGQNSIIGAGSVVTKSIEPNTIVAGNPAKIIRKIQ